MWPWVSLLSGNGSEVDDSTVFLDFLGPLGGGNTATWTNSSANKAVEAVGQRIEAAVRQGFIARAAADWQARATPL
jgi:hypothetical protein